MRLRRIIIVVGLACSSAALAMAQDSNPPTAPPADQDTNPVLKHRPAESREISKSIVKENIDLAVPAGSALQVVLDSEVRLKAVGQPIHGRIVEPVFAFDKLVIPVGTEVNGKISQIASVSVGTRIVAALDGNLTPDRKIAMEFTELLFADGRHFPVQTTVVPGSGQVLRFVAAAESQRKTGVKDAVTQKEREAKEEARREFEAAMQQVKEPGRLHRVERLALEQFPVHPQFIDAGTVYFAELRAPLEFGTESLTPEMATSMNGDIPPGSMVHARLMTTLDSASTPKGAAIEAILSRPLIVDGKLLLPQGTELKGSVVQVAAARYWKHNGQLRFVFRDLKLPNGIESRVETILQGIESGETDKLNLDAEGGAETQTPKARFLTTGIAVALAAATHEDDVLNRSAGGAGGFKVVGIVIGATVRSQQLAIAMGAFGASRSIYDNFISRGRDVVFAKHTAMEIGVDTRETVPSQSPTATSAPHN